MRRVNSSFAWIALHGSQREQRKQCSDTPSGSVKSPKRIPANLLRHLSASCWARTFSSDPFVVDVGQKKRDIFLATSHAPIAYVTVTYRGEFRRGIMWGSRLYHERSGAKLRLILRWEGNSGEAYRIHESLNGLYDGNESPIDMSNPSSVYRFLESLSLARAHRKTYLLGVQISFEDFFL